MKKVVMTLAVLAMGLGVTACDCCGKSNSCYKPAKKSCCKTENRCAKPNCGGCNSCN